MCRVGTPTQYPRRVSKAPFAPDDRQAKLLSALRRVHQQKARVDAEYKRVLADCAEADIPIAKLAEELKTQRKTIYRHLGRSMT